MVNEYLRYRIPPELREKFLADYTAACEQLRESPVPTSLQWQRP